MIKDKTLPGKLYENLRRHRGSFQRIAQKCNCHRNWVRMVLKGEYVDIELIGVAAEVLKEIEEGKATIMIDASKKLEDAINLAYSY